MTAANSKQVDIMNCGIYRMNFPDGSAYVGASIKIKERLQTQLSWLRNGKGQTKPLQAAYDKFGVPDIVTVLVCSAKNLPMYEQIVFKTLSKPLCNPKIGGIAGKSLSQETKHKMSVSAKLKTQTQSKRQLETWSDPDIRSRRLAGLRAYFDAKKGL